MQMSSSAIPLAATSAGTWAKPRSGQNSNGGANPATAVIATGATVPVVAAVPAAPAHNKALMYGGLALLAWFVFFKKK